MKTAKHPDGLHVITFDPKWHTYTDNKGQKYTSVTKFVGNFFQKFDAESMSIRCSQKEGGPYFGMNPEEIKRQWKEKGEKSMREGTNMHEYAEYVLTGRGTRPLPVSPRATNLFGIVDRAVNKLKARFEFINAEMIVFDTSLRIAGTLDLIMFDKPKKEYVILDWKQNETITQEYIYQYALEPIKHLGDTKLNHYALQLSLYRYILEQNNYAPAYGFRQALVHITEDTYKPLSLPYLKSEIEGMIKAWKK